MSIKLEPHDILLCRNNYGFWSKIRCLVGLHYWHEVGFVSLLNPIQLERCRRCGVGRQFQFMGALMYYSKPEMDKIMQKKHNNV